MLPGYQQQTHHNPDNFVHPNSIAEALHRLAWGAALVQPSPAGGLPVE